MSLGRWGRIIQPTSGSDCSSEKDRNKCVVSRSFVEIGLGGFERRWRRANHLVGPHITFLCCFFRLIVLLIYNCWYWKSPVLLSLSFRRILGHSRQIYCNVSELRFCKRKKRLLLDCLQVFSSSYWCCLLVRPGNLFWRADNYCMAKRSHQVLRGELFQGQSVLRNQPHRCRVR